MPQGSQRNKLVPPGPATGNPLAGQSPAWMTDPVSAGAAFIAEQRAQAEQQGLVDPTTGWPTQKGVLDVVNQYTNSLLMGTLSPGTNALAAGFVGTKLASRSARMYNLPSLKGSSADAYALAQPVRTGSVAGGLYDQEGRSLTAPVVAGRRGSDSLVESPVSSAELHAVSAQALGVEPLGVPQTELPKRTVGFFQKTYDSETGLPKFLVKFDKNLPDASQGQVAAHEVAHGLDHLSGTIPTEGLDGELRNIYNLQNNPQTHGKPFGPEQNGYKDPGDIRSELMAEAIRGYMTQPDSFNLAAPQTASAIRGAINAHPTLSKIIQFNAAGGMAYGLSPAGDDATGQMPTPTGAATPDPTNATAGS